MQNRLPDLEQEDQRYNLHVGAEPIYDYNITLIWPSWTPPISRIMEVPLQPPAQIKANLSKLGIFL
jgi:hypothetical protein